MTEGYIYCLSNPSFISGLYKVGFTTSDPQLRSKQRNNFRRENYKILRQFLSRSN